MTSENLHKGHRERLKKQFLESGLDSFHEHQILELLLFYSIPQKDTNDIAHSLINEFGSLAGVFEASYEELITVKGIKHNSAVLIKMIPELYRQQCISMNKLTELHETEFAKSYIRNKYEEFVQAKLTAYTDEVFLVLCLDNSNRIKNCSIITKGTPADAHVEPRKIVEVALRNNSTNLIIAHNHPGGMARPSAQDCKFTENLEKLLAPLKINLRDHIIVSDASRKPYTSTFSMASHEKLSKIFRANFKDQDSIKK